MQDPRPTYSNNPTPKPGSTARYVYGRLNPYVHWTDDELMDELTEYSKTAFREPFNGAPPVKLCEEVRVLHRQAQERYDLVMG